MISNGKRGWWDIIHVQRLLTMNTFLSLRNLDYVLSSTLRTRSDKRFIHQSGERHYESKLSYVRIQQIVPARGQTRTVLSGM